MMKQTIYTRNSLFNNLVTTRQQATLSSMVTNKNLRFFSTVSKLYINLNDNNRDFKPSLIRYDSLIRENLQDTKILLEENSRYLPQELQNLFNLISSRYNDLKEDFNNQINNPETDSQDKVLLQYKEWDSIIRESKEISQIIIDRALMVPKEVKLEFYDSYEYILWLQIEIMHETDNKEIFKDEYLSMYVSFGDFCNELDSEELLDRIDEIDEAVNQEDRGSDTSESTQKSFESSRNSSLCSLPDFSTGQACLPSHSSSQASLPGSFDQEGLDNGGLESSESNNNNQEESGTGNKRKLSYSDYDSNDQPTKKRHTESNNLSQEDYSRAEDLEGMGDSLKNIKSDESENKSPSSSQVSSSLQPQNPSSSQDSSPLQNYPIQQASIRYVRWGGEPVDSELFTQNFGSLTADGEGKFKLRVSDSLLNRQGSGSLIDDYADLSLEYMDPIDPD